jgi:hypothetical protein
MAMDPGERVVPSGAIATAMMIVESLHGRADEDDAEALAAGVGRWGRETLLDAFGLLVYTAVSVVHPETGSEDEDQLHMILPAVVSRFRKLQLPEVPDETLPTVAGIITAACVGVPPYAWRTSIGPISDREGLVWCYTAWLLIDFMDNVVFGEKPGRFAEILNATLAQDPESDEV